ncbi:MAG: hypothetical protein ACRD3D_06805 [Terriglobia bacterium]
MEEKAENRRTGGVPPPRVATAVEDSPKSVPLPVWFFVGIIFVVYGVIIFITGLLELHHPPSTVLAGELHPTIWWGAVIAGLGVLFVATTGPWSRGRRSLKHS